MQVAFALQPAFAGTRGDKAVRPHLVHHAGNGMFALREGEEGFELGRRRI